MPPHNLGPRNPLIDEVGEQAAGAFQDVLADIFGPRYFAEPVIRHEPRASSGDQRVIANESDSLEPLLSSDNRIMVDTGQRVPVPPGIFVIWDGMGLVAKRVEHEPNSEPPMVLIKSVNPDYDTYKRDAEEVHVIGRVVWAARRM